MISTVILSTPSISGIRGIPASVFESLFPDSLEAFDKERCRETEDSFREFPVKMEEPPLPFRDCCEPKWFKVSSSAPAEPMICASSLPSAPAPHSGRTRAPKTIPFRMRPPRRTSVQRQLKASSRNSVIGARRNMPTPEPHTAIPVASARFSSKYTLTETMEGRYISPNPTPGGEK